MNAEVVTSCYPTVTSQHRNTNSSDALAEHRYLMLDQFTGVCKNEVVEWDLSWDLSARTGDQHAIRNEQRCPPNRHHSV